MSAHACSDFVPDAGRACEVCKRPLGARMLCIAVVTDDPAPGRRTEVLYDVAGHRECVEPIAARHHGRGR